MSTDEMARTFLWASRMALALRNELGAGVNDFMGNSISRERHFTSLGNAESISWATTVWLLILDAWGGGAGWNMRAAHMWPIPYLK